MNINADTPIQAGLRCIKQQLGLKVLVGFKAGLKPGDAGWLDQAMALQPAETQLGWFDQAVNNIPDAVEDIEPGQIVRALYAVARLCA